jgi:hypothetical protein
VHALRLTLLAAALALPVQGHAAVTESSFQLATAADLAALCAAQPDDKYFTAAQNFCEGFATAASRVLAKEEAAGGQNSFCLPTPSPSRDDVKAAFVAFIAQTPAVANAPPEDSMLLFLQHQYPCGGAK